MPRLAAATCALCLLYAGTAGAHDVTPEDYFSLATVTDLAVSPDGKHVAYCEARWDRKENNRRTDLWVVPTSGKGTINSYAVPTARKGGIWATPGAVLGPNGNVYVASGNGAQITGAWDMSDSVTELDPVTMARKSVFGPAEWLWRCITYARLQPLRRTAPRPEHRAHVAAG